MRRVLTSIVAVENKYVLNILSALMLGRAIPSIKQIEVFLIDVIIKNQDIKKLETTCFGLTLAIISFHLVKLFCKSVIQFCKRALVLYNTLTEQLFKMKPDDGHC